VLAAHAAGVRLRGDADARRGRAVAGDLGFSGARAGGASGPPGTADPRTSATEAWARGLVGIARDHALTYLDVWVTDRVGHRADLALATDLVAHLDAVLAALVAALDEVTLVVVSDHGNLEDASAPRHTRSMVPLVAIGPAAAAFSGARDLRDVRPALRRAWGFAEPVA
jgi:2,3-bisphosphoglycerate-independent phosphoglycerate mutase